MPGYRPPMQGAGRGILSALAWANQNKLLPDPGMMLGATPMGRARYAFGAGRGISTSNTGAKFLEMLGPRRVSDPLAATSRRAEMERRIAINRRRLLEQSRPPSIGISGALANKRWQKRSGL